MFIILLDINKYVILQYSIYLNKNKKLFKLKNPLKHQVIIKISQFSKGNHKGITL